MVIDELSKYVRNPVYVKGLTSRLSVHEAIKSQLYVLGYRLGYVPVLEAVTNSAGRKRIDCVFCKGESIVCAIEIDYSIKKKSIEKLLSLSDGTERIVISYGSREARCKARYRHHDRVQLVKHYVMNTQFDR